jgi:hypothetical protein
MGMIAMTFERKILFSSKDAKDNFLYNFSGENQKPIVSS